MNEPEHDNLIRLAGAVADGDRVDWEREHDASPVTQRGKIRHLQMMEAMRDAASADVEVEPTIPLRWGPLRIVERIGGGAYGEVFRP